MTEPLSKRSEILFLYDVTDANPNGDPDENKPRIDPISGLNLVTDVRLKRTVREYWKDFKGKKIFIDLEAKNQDGTVQTGEQRFNDFKNLEGMMKECIDVRAFGALIPIKGTAKKGKSPSKEASAEESSDEANGPDDEEDESNKRSIKYIGPVQFRVGRSLHKVNLVRIKQSAAFASGAKKYQRSIGEKYLVNYSLVKFYGVVNEHNAHNTGFSEEDAQAMFEAMWNGTKNLMTSSKFGHMPRLLVRVEYNEPNYFIGELDSLIRLSPSS